MFGKRVTLFKLFDFAVRIDLSWLVILVLVVASLSAGVFPSEYPDLAWPTYLAMGLSAAVGLFGSIVVHELCHSLVARRYGLPMKGITLFIFGGVAEMEDEPASPKAEVLMALAGPAASVAVAGAAAGAWALGRQFGWPAEVTGVIAWIGLINAILVGFNLIPGFPLDGGRVLRAILWHVKGDLRAATRIAAKVGRVFGLVLIGLGILNLLAMNPIGGLWWILIGMFIRGAAARGYQQVLVRQALQGETVRRFMHDQPITVPASTPLEELVENYVYKYHYKLFAVMEDGRLAGCVTTRDVREVPRDQWRDRTVGDVARGCSAANTIAPDADATEALARMSKHEASRLLVVEDGRLEGILTLKDLLKFLSLKIELEGESGPIKPKAIEHAPPAALPGGGNE